MERLLDYFIPKHYDLKLNINKASGKVYGEVQISGAPTGKIDAFAPTHTVPNPPVVKLHAKNLKITELKLNGVTSDYTQADDILMIPLPDSAIPAAPVKSAAAPKTAAEKATTPVKLSIKYTFHLNTNMEGAYLSSYDLLESGAQTSSKTSSKTPLSVSSKATVPSGSAKELLVSTQFESHYARECFPCIDEPAAKATFSLKLITPDIEDTALSNTPVKEEKVIEYESVDENLSLGKLAKKKIITFEDTPKMSTYLLAFCLGRFHSRSKKTKSGVTVTSYCTLNHSPECLDYANTVAVKSLDFYDQKFGVKYPLPKLDQVAIPDFEAGAMENWGLVTYRESCLLVDKNASIDTREYVALVIAHELSHQWFGNLVTMQWWDNLWLNESFANLMEYVCVDAIFPDYHIWQDFYTGDCLAALSRDALPGVQAVQQDVEDPAEIATLFDSAIVYAKGARLMYWLYRLMGEKRFFSGLKEYFKAHRYSNTTGDDLWAALQKHADFDVKKFMDGWILQPGYPVITDGEAQRFLITGATDDTKWYIPEVTDDMSGHYLVNLSSDEFQSAIANFSKLSLEQRIRLLIDRMLLAKTSLVSSASLLDLLLKFRDEENNSIWEIIFSIIGNLKLFFSPDDPDYTVFQRYLSYLIQPQLDRLGITPKKGESDNDAKLRQLLLAVAYLSEDKTVESALAALYQEDYLCLDPDIRLAIIRAKLCQADIFADLVAKYQRLASPDVRSDVLSAIGGCKTHTSDQIALLRRPEVVKPQDQIYLLAYLCRNHYAHKACFDWLTTEENWQYLEQLTGDKSLEDYPRILASTIRTKEDSEQFDAFFGPKKNNPVLRRVIEVAQGEINARLRLISLDQDDVHRRLKELI